MRSKYWLKTLSLSLVMFFALMVSAEGFVHHHHHSQKEDSDCSYCSFHKNISQSKVSAAPLGLIPLFTLFLVAPTPKQVFHSIRFSVHSGRSPPAVLS
ncbi:MAG TPA: hypothetical protein VHE12_06415 [bacterium]|nr:hypothetical protein [bacterium]